VEPGRVEEQDLGALDAVDAQDAAARRLGQSRHDGELLAEHEIEQG
jgi:hypothetical protein